MAREMTWARTNYLTREIRRLALTDAATRARSARRLEALRAELAGPSWELFKKEREARVQLPEHVELCPDCGCAPAHDMTIPKWVFLEVGDCWCEPTEDADADAQEEVG